MDLQRLEPDFESGPRNQSAEIKEPVRCVDREDAVFGQRTLVELECFEGQ